MEAEVSDERGEGSIGLFDHFRFHHRFGRQDLGRYGERLAAKELRKRGYKILERRWRCRLGEIDLIAQDGETLVIVEVKTRSRRDYGAPADAVDARKRRKLIQLAEAYLRARRLRDVTVRFDVVGVACIRGEKPEITVLRSAFEA